MGWNPVIHWGTSVLVRHFKFPSQYGVSVKVNCYSIPSFLSTSLLSYVSSGTHWIKQQNCGIVSKWHVCTYRTLYFIYFYTKDSWIRLTLSYYYVIMWSYLWQILGIVCFPRLKTHTVLEAASASKIFWIFYLGLSVVGRAARLRAALSGFRIPEGTRKFSLFPKFPDHLWAPPSLLFIGCWASFRGVRGAGIWSWLHASN